MTDDSTDKTLTAWEQFKQINDARLKEIERLGHADPLYDAHLEKINSAIDSALGQREDSSEISGKPDREEETEYSRAMRNYLRKGADAFLQVFNEPDFDGGYPVSTAMSALITRQVFQLSPLRKLASVEAIAGNSLVLLHSPSQPEFHCKEEDIASMETASPMVVRRSIPTHELYAQPKATQELLDDAASDIESWISSGAADIFARREDEGFVHGNGAGQPRGILSYPAGTGRGKVEQVLSGVNGTLTAEGLISLFYSLKDTYTKGASFLMNRTVVQQARLLKQTSTNHYLWQPGLSAGAPDTLIGAPVFMAKEMPTASKGSLSVAFGDFKSAYRIVDGDKLRILRDPFTEKPFVKFYVTKRVGGDVTNFEAIKLLRLSA